MKVQRYRRPADGERLVNLDRHPVYGDAQLIDAEREQVADGERKARLPVRRIKGQFPGQALRSDHQTSAYARKIEQDGFAGLERQSDVRHGDLDDLNGLSVLLYCRLLETEVTAQLLPEDCQYDLFARTIGEYSAFDANERTGLQAQRFYPAADIKLFLDSHADQLAGDFVADSHIVDRHPEGSDERYARYVLHPNGSLDLPGKTRTGDQQRARTVFDDNVIGVAVAQAQPHSRCGDADNIGVVVRR